MYHPKVFRVSYEDDHHHRTATCGGMDSDYSHTTRERVSELVVGYDLTVSKFMWEHRSRAITSRTNVEWEELGNVTMMIEGGVGLY